MPMCSKSPGTSASPAPTLRANKASPSSITALAKAKKGDDGHLVVGQGGARLCCLAQDCDEKQYVTLVKALCQEKGVPLIEVPEAIALGEWAGLCKLDKEMKPRKVVSTSVVVVTDFGEKSHELDVLQASLKKASE